MAVIRVDPDWVAAYADVVARGAESLGRGAELLREHPVTAESFGSLGRTVRVTDSYLSAAEGLRAQLLRGVAAMDAASASLRVVAEKYRGSDEDGVHTLKRSGGE